MTTLKRIISSGVKAFYRNGLLSTSAILVITIALLVSLASFLSIETLKASTTQLEKKIDINIYFKQEALEENILSYKEDLEKIDEVLFAEYISKEQALENFKKRHADNENLLKALEITGENPLTAVLNIKAKELSKYSYISDFIESKETQEKYPIIENANYNQNRNAIEKLNVLIYYVEIIGIFISLILLGLSLVVTYNTIRLTIYIYKEDISIMKLVGASNFFTRGPFLVEGIIYGFVASFFALAISWVGIFYAAPHLSEIFILDINVYFSREVFEIYAGLLIAGILIGVISSYLAVRKYLEI